MADTFNVVIGDTRISKYVTTNDGRTVQEDWFVAPGLSYPSADYDCVVAVQTALMNAAKELTEVGIGKAAEKKRR